MASGEDTDKRREERVTINKEFESFDAFIHEYVTNISRSGVFVKSKTPLGVGTKVNLKFTVIMDDIETIEGVGKVVRVQDDPPGMGVVFTELSQYSEHLIERLLKAPDTDDADEEEAGDGVDVGGDA
jgi:Tfp pilus assembly protein PilZ